MSICFHLREAPIRLTTNSRVRRNLPCLYPRSPGIFIVDFELRANFVICGMRKASERYLLYFLWSITPSVSMEIFTQNGEFGMPTKRVYNYNAYKLCLLFKVVI